jgi:hypothetical protein
MGIPTTYPPAKLRLIPPGASDPPIVPVVVSFHVAVSLARSLFGWFNGPSGGIESHLYLLRDGTWEQYRTFDREADAQLGGNSWPSGGRRLGSITIETQGLALGWWSPEQRRELKAFALWSHENLGIPLRVVTVPNPTTLAAGGFGYHSLFPAWNSLRKSCPGPNRVRWFNDHFAPWLAEQGRVFAAFLGDDTITKFATRHNIAVATLWRLNRKRPVTGESLRIR